MTDPAPEIDRRLREARAEERRRRDADAAREARLDGLIADAIAERNKGHSPTG